MRRLMTALFVFATACASLETVHKTPGRDIVAALLVVDLQCRDTAEKKCDPAEQPKEIRISAIDCEALPLRPATRERAHAACAFSGEIVRVNGTASPLLETVREFSLVELTPGVRVPEKAWTLVPNR
ncbi:MAG: hypothetical protein HXY21_04780 [Parvularculaceae bacterium]|nr:hypothetical protein [Parvularculaceae bacterium]